MSAAPPAPRVLLVDDNRGFRLELRLLLEAARALRERAPALPVIILSAYEDPALKSEAAAANAYAYLVKGCSGGLVLDTIEQAFQATR